MKASRLQPLTIAVGSFLAGCWLTAAIGTSQRVEARSHRVFELRLYHVNPGRLPALKTFFGERVLPTFKKHGMTSIGYWVPQDKPESENLWIYVVAHPSREDATKNWAAFNADPMWQAALKASQVDGQLVNKIDSTFMEPADFSPLK
jgi:NIPSNAP